MNSHESLATFVIVDKLGEIAWYMPDPRAIDVRFAEALLLRLAGMRSYPGLERQGIAVVGSINMDLVPTRCWDDRERGPERVQARGHRARCAERFAGRPPACKPWARRHR